MCVQRDGAMPCTFVRFNSVCSSLLALYNGRHMPFTLAAQLDCCWTRCHFQQNSTQNVNPNRLGELNLF